MIRTPALAGIAAVCLLAGCNSSTPLGSFKASVSSQTPPAATADAAPVTETRAGSQQHAVIASPVDGADISFEMFEPDQLVAGETYPLVLQGHGYGGSRQTARSGFIARLTAAGYYVISIDQRGFGASGGQGRGMSPDFEGQDLIAILDWAEALPGLRRRADGSMLVGSYGGSYGGMYQMLLAGADPKQRLRVMAPDITPHDLSYAFNAGNVPKSGWGLLLLTAGGEAGTVTNIQSGVIPDGTQQDPTILESLASATLTGAISESAQNYLRYHSARYFCEGVPAGDQSFILGEPDPRAVPPAPYGKIDVLFTQGFRDTLFNFNDAFNNYNCLKARGGDVRLLTHQSGHILAAGPAGGGGLVPLPVPSVEGALDPFYLAVNFPGFQDPGASRACGTINLDDAQFAWFEEKLQNRGKADDVVRSGSQVCLSLAEGDAVTMTDVKVGGVSFPIAADMPQFNAALGVAGTALGNAPREALLSTLPLYTAPAGGAVIAGIPTMELSVNGLSGLELGSCPVPVVSTACDPVLFLALGRRAAGTERWDLIDDQLTPLRGFGAHSDLMSGIAERLDEGDQLALLIYGFHPQYPGTSSRDPFVPAVTLDGLVSLPILTDGEYSPL